MGLGVYCEGNGPDWGRQRGMAPRMAPHEARSLHDVGTRPSMILLIMILPCPGVCPLTLQPGTALRTHSGSVLWWPTHAHTCIDMWTCGACWRLLAVVCCRTAVWGGPGTQPNFGGLLLAATGRMSRASDALLPQDRCLLSNHERRTQGSMPA